MILYVKLIGVSFFLILLIQIISSASDPTDVIENQIGGNIVEGFLKDIFKKEMGTIDRANMTDCMTRLLCEQICTRTASGQIKEPLLDSRGIMGTDPSLPKTMDYFFAGGDRGFVLGQLKQCARCAYSYPNCDDEQYEYAKELTNSYT